MTDEIDELALPEACAIAAFTDEAFDRIDAARSGTTDGSEAVLCDGTREAGSVAAETGATGSSTIESVVDLLGWFAEDEASLETSELIEFEALMTEEVNDSIDAVLSPSTTLDASERMSFPASDALDAAELMLEDACGITDFSLKVAVGKIELTSVTIDSSERESSELCCRGESCDPLTCEDA